MFSVRGIGVAVSVSTSALAEIFFSFSFCATPKRCSSSIMTSPSFANSTSEDISLCVPTIISVSPRLSLRSDASCCFFVRKRDTISTDTGNDLMRESSV